MMATLRQVLQALLLTVAVSVGVESTLSNYTIRIIKHLFLCPHFRGHLHVDIPLSVRPSVPPSARPFSLYLT
jgi:hypothetical protein